MLLERKVFGMSRLAARPHGTGLGRRLGTRESLRRALIYFLGLGDPLIDRLAPGESLLHSVPVRDGLLA